MGEKSRQKDEHVAVISSSSIKRNFRNFSTQLILYICR